MAGDPADGETAAYNAFLAARHNLTVLLMVGVGLRLT